MKKAFGLQQLYDVCRIARELTYELNIGRVIARPFVGTAAENFTRTGNRKDYAVLPPSPTLARLSDRKPAAMSSPSARSATSSPIPAPAAKSRWRAMMR